MFETIEELSEETAKNVADFVVFLEAEGVDPKLASFICFTMLDWMKAYAANYAEIFDSIPEEKRYRQDKDRAFEMFKEAMDKVL